jgi:hypothetical protein
MLSTGELFNPAIYEQAKCKPGFVASSEEHAVKMGIIYLTHLEIFK